MIAITTSWLVFYVLLIVLGLGFAWIEIYRAGYRKGWSDRDVKRLMKEMVDAE